MMNRTRLTRPTRFAMDDDKEFGIQLTERQLALQEQRRQRNPPPAASTTTTTATAASIPPTATRPLQTRSNISTASTASATTASAATSTASKHQDQKALLRLLERSMAKKNQQKKKEQGTKVTVTIPKPPTPSLQQPLPPPQPQPQLHQQPQPSLQSYETFVAALQKELAGDHTELWRSFRSLFGIQSIPYEHSIPQKCKFDDTTKQLLTDINIHVKKSTTMECQPTTQLVNDKSYKKSAKQTRTKLIVNEPPPVTIQLLPPKEQPEETWANFDAAFSSLLPVDDTPATTALPTKLIFPDYDGITSKSKSISAPTNEPIEINTPVKVPYRTDFATKPPPVQTPPLKSIREDDSTPGSSGRKRRMEPPWNEVKLKPATWSTVKLKEDTKKSQLGEVYGIQWITVDDSKLALPTTKSSPPIIFSPEKKQPKEIQLKPPVSQSIAQPTDKCIPWSTVKLKATSHKPEQPTCDLQVPQLLHTAIKPKPKPFVPTDNSSLPWTAIKLKATSLNNLLDEPNDEPIPPLPTMNKPKPVPKPVQSFVPPDIGSVPWTAIKLKATTGIKPVDEPREEPRDEPPLPLRTINKPKPAPKPVQSFVPPDNGSVPWTTLKLKASKEISSTTADENGSGGASVEPWFNVKLRPVEEMHEELRSMEVDNNSTTLPFRPMLRKVMQLSPSKPATQTPICELDDNVGINIGDEIDLNSLPEQAVTIALQRTPGMPEQHSEAIVAAKSALFITRNTGDGAISRVTWRISRSRVQSLTLDMADNTAILSLNDGSTKRLDFPSAEECLQFANVFYETNKAKVLDQVDQFKKDRQHVVAPHDEAAMGEVLNEEEQQLLEKYRAMRKTKAVDEALRGSMPDMVTTTLCETDEKVVAAYRKMLQLQIPLEAVEHKMTKDGVSEIIRQAVLETTTTTTDPGLSDEDDKAAELYRKMLRICVPPEAVREKMKKDNVDQKIIDAVLLAFSNSNTTSDDKEERHQLQTETKSESNLNAEDENVASTYRKMLKMMIPPDAVKHRMKKDQIDAKIVQAIFPDEVASKPVDQTTAIVLSSEEETIAKTYRRMLQMMIPTDAVRHKMTKDNVDERIVVVVLGPNPDTEKKVPALSKKDEKIADSYRKMLKMMIPPDAVRHKMLKEGASTTIIAAVLGDDTKDAKSTAAQSKLRGSNLVALQWTPLSGEELDNGVWRVIKKRRVTTAQPEGSDISKLVQLFQKKSTIKGSLGALPAADAAGADSKAKLIDINRANNVAISLKAFKEFTHSELAATISHLDPHRLIHGERVQFVKDILPTTSEAKSIQNYKGIDSRLVPAELFFKEVANIKRIETKVHVMQTMDTFKENATQLIENFKVLSQACRQVQTSEKLQDVLEMVLHVGNIMNEGTRTGGASGFKFDSLLKLTQTKSSDGKTTVLDYMVMIFVAKEKRQTLKLGDDFPDCQAASRMLISDMVGEVTEMGNALKKCKDELQNLKDEVSGSHGPKLKVKKDELVGDPRASMFAAIKARNQDSDETTSNPSSNLLAAIKSRPPYEARSKYLTVAGARNTTGEAEGKVTTLEVQVATGKSVEAMVSLPAASIPRSIFNSLSRCTNPDILSITSGDDEEKKESESMLPDIKEGTLTSGMARLERFIFEADEILKKLLGDKTNTLKACKELSKYCGETGGERVTSTLLNILSQFAINLSAAVEKHDNRKEAETRKDAAAKKKPATGVQGNATESTVPRLPVLRNRESYPADCSPTPSLARNSLESIQSTAEAASVGANIKGSLVTHDVAATSIVSPGTRSNRTQRLSRHTAMRTPMKASTAKDSSDGHSLVLMVNKMLKAAPTNVKEDFAKGVVYTNPADPTLHRIYKKEQHLGSFGASPQSTQMDIMSAIKKRREIAEYMEESQT